jgi:hypothetical protein
MRVLRTGGKTGARRHPDSMEHMTLEERRNRAIDWLESIYKDVQDTIVDNHVFWEIQGIVKANIRLAETPSIFKQWMASGFVQAAALGVRRQADKADGCVSLHRLLLEIRAWPSIVSRASVRDLYLRSNLERTIAAEYADGDYDRLVGPELMQPNPGSVQIEIDELLAKADGIRHYVDRRVAHYDIRGIQQPLPTFNDLDECLALLERLVKKYKILLTGAGITTLLPTFQYDWKAVFYFPWLSELR